MTCKTKAEVEEFLNKYNTSKSATKYTIHDDLTVDVQGSVYFRQNFEELPIQFGTVTGGFTMENYSLTSLKGFPKEVKMYLIISFSKLTSLSGYNGKMDSLEIMNNDHLKSLRNEMDIRTNIFAENFEEFSDYYDRTENCLTIPPNVVREYYSKLDLFNKMETNYPLKSLFQKMKI